MEGVTIVGKPGACDFQSTCLLGEFQTEGGELVGVLDTNLSVTGTGVVFVAGDYGVDAAFDLLASRNADDDPRRNSDPVYVKPFPRLLARQTPDPAERHWRAVRKIISYLNKTKG